MIPHNLKTEQEKPHELEKNICGYMHPSLCTIYLLCTIVSRLCSTYFGMTGNFWLVIALRDRESIPCDQNDVTVRLEKYPDHMSPSRKEQAFQP